MTPTAQKVAGLFALPASKAITRPASTNAPLVQITAPPASHPQFAQAANQATSSAMATAL